MMKTFGSSRARALLIATALGAFAWHASGCSGTVQVFGDGADTGGAGQGGDAGMVATSVGTGTGGNSGPNGSSGTNGPATVTATGTSSGTGGMSGTSVASSTTAGPSSTTAGPSSVTAVTSSSGPTTASSSSTGGGSMCIHEPCKEGPALPEACDKCVATICMTDPFCCMQNWDSICVSEVLSLCGVTCPGDPGTPPCTTLYGKTNGFSLCSETPAECEFAINATTASCGTVCAQGGGECIALINDVNNMTCAKPQNPMLNPQSCNSMQFQSAICICTHGCGGGLPCPMGQTCKGGVCN
ncbi:MAG: hypothetical protein EXR75_04105 [Myxococcales bacterium]|nr:hypothetical protein [Myxococcales bacterium]